MVDLLDYWSHHPPVHEMLAAHLGVKPAPAPAAVDPADPSGIGAMMAQFPSGFVTANHP